MEIKEKSRLECICNELQDAHRLFLLAIFGMEMNTMDLDDPQNGLMQSSRRIQKLRRDVMKIITQMEIISQMEIITQMEIISQMEIITQMKSSAR